MSTLHSFSCFIGRAMKLPPVFFTKVPYIGILDQSIRIRDFVGSRSRRSSRARRLRSGSAAPKQGISTQQVMLEGRISEGTQTRFAIEGIDFAVTAGTWIIGEPQLGSKARVKGMRSASSTTVMASSIVVMSG